MAKSITRPATDARAGAPREMISEQRVAPMGAANERAGVPHDELRRQIAEAAYYKAQSRGFAPGYEEKDWIEAEAEILSRLGLQP